VNRADEDEAKEGNAGKEQNGDDRVSQVPNLVFYVIVHRGVSRWLSA
jgi:hypothetical protein